MKRSFGGGSNTLSMESCRFVTTAAGTAVYAGDSSYLGLYETEDAAVKMIRLMLSEYSDGGSADEI